MMRERETNRIRNVTGIAIPLFESQKRAGTFFGRLRLAAPSFPLEKQLESGIEAFCLFFFEKRLILAFSGRDSFGQK
jgi:hypothetical protein